MNKKTREGPARNRLILTIASNYGDDQREIARDLKDLSRSLHDDLKVVKSMGELLRKAGDSTVMAKGLIFAVSQTSRTIPLNGSSTKNHQTIENFINAASSFADPENSRTFVIGFSKVIKMIHDKDPNDPHVSLLRFTLQKGTEILGADTSLSNEELKKNLAFVTMAAETLKGAHRVTDAIELFARREPRPSEHVLPEASTEQQ